jgi:hypothetical protein
MQFKIFNKKAPAKSRGLRRDVGKIYFTKLVNYQGDSGHGLRVNTRRAFKTHRV